MKKVIVLGIACVLGVAGCSGIRVVRASKAGGEIALIGDRQAAMEKASLEMERVCGGPINQAYEIVEEFEAVVGEVSDTRGSGYGRRGFVMGSSHTDTTQKTEWRVKYACRGAAQPAPAGGPPATGAPASQIHEIIIRY